MDTSPEPDLDIEDINPLSQAKMPPESPHLLNVDDDLASDVDGDLDDNDVAEDLERDPDYLDDNPDDDMVAFGAQDPKSLSYNSVDDDCESVIYDRGYGDSQRHGHQGEGYQLGGSRGKYVDETVLSETVIDEHVLNAQAHPEENDPFHRFVPSPNGEDDFEEDEVTLVNYCDEEGCAFLS